jgi:diguanylate cyclase (GGDEF)-like protein
VNAQKREADRGSLRALHYHLSFLLAAILLGVDTAMSFAGLNSGFDPLRAGTLASLAFVAAIGLEVERHGKERPQPRKPKGVMLGIIGLLQTLLCLRTGGIASPYFLLVASTCVFAGLTLPLLRAMYLTTLVVAGYIFGMRVSGAAGGLVDGASVVALAMHVAFVFLSTSLAARVTASMHRTVATLAVQSASDPLTSLDNRRAFTERLQVELQRSERFSWPITMLVVDLDHFKKLNDMYGHAVGDEVLVETAKLLRDVAGTLDHVARVGGEEFAVAAVAAEPYHGRDLADRIVRGFRSRNWARIRPGLKVTASVGVAVLPPGLHRSATADAVGTLLEHADRALYHVKQAGRDGFHVSEEAVPQVTGR